MTGAESAPEPLDRNLALPLEDSVVSALEKWQASTGLTLTLDRWMTEGHTRAPVAVVLVTGPQPPSKVILKACPPERLTSREPRLHSQALSRSPGEFANRHLVEQPFETIECADKWRVLFQSIAGDSLRVVRPLSSVLHDERLPELVEQIATSLLQDWNPQFQTRRVTPYDLLRSDLASKIDRNGPLADFVRKHGVGQASWIRFSTDLAEVVPNAIFWALDSSPWPRECESLWAQFGNSHGDLHPGNVLIEVDPTPRAENFRLIDLSAFTPEGSLAKDITHLCLAIVGEHLTDIPSRRKQLLAIALGDARPVPLDLRGLREVVETLRYAATTWQSSTMKGMQDDWSDQMALALVAGGLEFVGRRSLPLSQRLWFFQLSCMALGRYVNRHKLVERPVDPAAVQIVGPLVGAEIEVAVERLLESFGSFAGTHSAVAVLTAALPPSASERVGEFPWTAVMSFDPELDRTGALAVARQVGARLHRLVTLGQTAEYRHGSTAWFALGGLSDLADTTMISGLRLWRRSYKRTIDDGISTLNRFSARPLTVVVFGEPDDRVRAIVEAVDERFADRAQIILVSDGPADLGEFTDLHLKVDPARVITALPSADGERALGSTVPGHDGPVTLDPEDGEWIREMADLVDSAAGTTAGEIEDVGRGFLQGRVVSWFELSLGIDVVPRVMSALLTRVREDIAGRDTRRISLLHYPGAGGTTLARRIAWETHLEVPTLYCPTTRDDFGLAQRLGRLSRLTGLPVLVVLEQTTDLVADRFYNRLRGESVPAVVLVVSRRLERPQESGPRSFYLGPAATAADLAALVQRYGEYAPHRLDQLSKVRRGDSTAVPFYFGLLAFEEEYDGLENYVRHSVANLTEVERDVLLLVALSHRYGGVSVAADLFADVLNVQSDDAVLIGRMLSESARTLLIEDESGFWRTAHWLVAAEILRQLLTPPSGADDAWRLSLSALALRLIGEARAVFGLEPPDDIRDVLERLFIVRENRELFGGERPRSFSELLEDIPSLNGRLEVLRQLAEHFPDESHYWAHYGRLLSYEGGDTQAALAAVNKALLLDERDSVLYHVRGMVYRSQLRDLSQRQASPPDDPELLRVAELALADFTEAARLDDDSEYPHVASAQVAVSAIEIAYRRSQSRSYAEFFSRPSAGPYRVLLAQAEAAIDAISEISGPDPFSARAEQAVVSLHALYDDYSALLQGWRNLLDRDDVIKAPVRRQLVRAYVRRAGDWNRLQPADRNRVLSLLEDNLRDDPTDAASLREWLRAARAGGANLDRAGELVSYWAAQAPTRDAFYYDYVVAVLQVLAGRDSAWREAQRKIERCRERAAAFGNRKFSYEWLGNGDGLGMLIHYSELPASWQRDSPDDIPAALRRVPARVASIGSPQAGTLRLEAGGLEAFFVPARAGALRGRHENARVEAVIGFSYDGLRAWSVRFATSLRSAPTL